MKLVPFRTVLAVVGLLLAACSTSVSDRIPQRDEQQQAPISKGNAAGSESRQAPRKSLSGALASLARSLDRYRCEPGTQSKLVCLSARMHLHELHAITNVESVAQAFADYQALLDMKREEAVPDYFHKKGRVDEIRFELTVDESYDRDARLDLVAEHNALLDDLRKAEAAAYGDPRATALREVIRERLRAHARETDLNLVRRHEALSGALLPADEDDRTQPMGLGVEARRRCNYQSATDWHEARDDLIAVDDGIRNRVEAVLESIEAKMRSLGYKGDDHYQRALATLAGEIRAARRASPERYELLEKYYALESKRADWRSTTRNVALQRRDIRDEVRAAEQALREAVCRRAMAPPEAAEKH